MLNAARLSLLVELEERGSLTAVADGLGYTPSAISQQLAKLEAETGRRLLEPVGRGVVLTDAGRTLARHAREVLERLEAAEASLETAERTVRHRAGGGLPDGGPGAARARSSSSSRASTRSSSASSSTRRPRPRCRACATGELDLVVAEEYEQALRPRDPAPPAARARRRRAAGGASRRASGGALGRSGRARGAGRLSPGPPRGRVPTTRAWSRAPAARRASSRCIRHRVTDLGTLLDLARAGLAVAIVPSLGRSGRGRLTRAPAGGGRRPGPQAVRGDEARGGRAARRSRALVAALRERLSGI